MARKAQPTQAPGGSDQTEFKTLDQAEIPGLDIESKLDIEKIEAIEKEIADKKKSINEKVYAITLEQVQLDGIINYIKYDAPWDGLEALGVKEVYKQLSDVKIENGVIFLKSLPLEACHYFVSKMKGKGLDPASTFLSIYKPLDQALNDAKKDATEIKDLERKHVAAMQGIEVE